MKTLNEVSGMPQMSAAFSGWFTNISLIKIEQEIKDSLVRNTQSVICFKGTVQPLSPQKLQLKPEGLRSFVWLQIHCFTNECINLKTNDLITYKDKNYKVMGILDYSLNNYIEYHVVEDFSHVQ